MKQGHLKVAVYARVSRLDQNPDNQLLELRRYVHARGWEGVTEFIESGVSGSKDRRPQLDAMMASVRRRQFDAVVCWKLDRLGRSTTHLCTLLDEFRALGVEFISMGEGIDTTTPAGRMIFQIIASIAEFERERLRERTVLGLDRARAHGKTLGRRPDKGLRRRVVDVAHLSVRKAAAALNCSQVTVQKLRRELSAKSAATTPLLPLEAAR